MGADRHGFSLEGGYDRLYRLRRYKFLEVVQGRSATAPEDYLQRCGDRDEVVHV